MTEKPFDGMKEHRGQDPWRDLRGQAPDQTFKDFPESVTERRATAANDASKATPRDALIAVLRDIDSGKIDPEALIVCWRSKIVDGAVSVGWEAASPDIVTTLGLLARATGRISSDAE